MKCNSAPPQTVYTIPQSALQTASSPEAAPPLSFGHSPNGGTFTKGSLYMLHEPSCFVLSKRSNTIDGADQYNEML